MALDANDTLFIMIDDGSGSTTRSILGGINLQRTAVGVVKLRVQDTQAQATVKAKDMTMYIAHDDEIKGGFIELDDHRTMKSYGIKTFDTVRVRVVPKQTSDGKVKGITEIPAWRPAAAKVEPQDPNARYILDTGLSRADENALKRACALPVWASSTAR
mmetsp:Transcript_11332/g.20101  ORF Transcript_11332/g.20101 Transcript_11332/m.20101 type:complete len:159 (+) Transcript_11332:75-551(+)|eukprot:CAMPEP_0197662946 /NCGR_PEP_ID=MMETSP1338-20131121/55474_1 /TAXON_ID=43686 ORGANISM="Pelagodinium beii, Strain RCC1491" /NCGR_SAMPLE_ID=MMETSP1338 /ASSEMBLY_ACC=CAM_ASM_000754 /LENGTH=158 /DNA_ID=CAMNT_0043241065 /DNA_START=69 /DNA_END=545 /DNA_ORIENTATION=+